MSPLSEYAQLVASFVPASHPTMGRLPTPSPWQCSTFRRFYLYGYSNSVAGKLFTSSFKTIISFTCWLFRHRCAQQEPAAAAHNEPWKGRGCHSGPGSRRDLRCSPRAECFGPPHSTFERNRRQPCGKFHTFRMCEAIGEEDAAADNGSLVHPLVQNMCIYRPG